MEELVKFLCENNLKITSAESCTGGLCAKRLTDIPGTSEIFHCGVVSYSNDIKMKVLGVKAETIEKYTEVSAECAKEMAEGVRLLSDADYGVSITGYAGPGDDEEVGLIYIGISDKNETRAVKLLTGHKGASCRDYNRLVASSRAFNELRLTILSE